MGSEDKESEEKAIKMPSIVNAQLKKKKMEKLQFMFGFHLQTHYKILLESPPIDCLLFSKTRAIQPISKLKAFASCQNFASLCSYLDKRRGQVGLTSFPFQERDKYTRGGKRETLLHAGKVFGLCICVVVLARGGGGEKKLFLTNRK
ncbi:hypothetical protein RFI_11765 [Reticulomyxa filosa]|uniref:Uncharacterized protein n=1 Tax=Reticulomyxa filosa TaxID=46433 RepID=X6NJ76_RETFI|nr:hypothetical protein RFI_11765 [Reticulomyxa filosa]|eukprot:ETO25372.1 hypothetical protein RFI_11765 [Reticulomyxa filosa]